MDPSWNPADDSQAMDRSYRIGQARDVNVYRLVAAATVEENVYERQLYKQQQSRIAVQGTSELRIFKGARLMEVPALQWRTLRLYRDLSFLLA